MKTHRHSPQPGFVLITALVFMTLVSLIALTAMQNSTLEQHVAKNMALKSNSLDAAEAGRDALGAVFDAHTYYRGWPSGAGLGGQLMAGLFDIPTGITVRDYDGDGIADKLYETKPPALADSVADMSNPDVYYDNSGIQAEIFVFRNLAQNAPGAAAAMVSGYEGTGKGSAGSGGMVFYDIRSRATLPGDTVTLLNADFRHVVRN